jgi:hypothetical protein
MRQQRDRRCDAQGVLLRVRRSFRRSD